MKVLKHDKLEVRSSENWTVSQSTDVNGFSQSAILGAVQTAKKVQFYNANTEFYGACIITAMFRYKDTLYLCFDSEILDIHEWHMPNFQRALELTDEACEELTTLLLYTEDGNN